MLKAFVVLMVLLLGCGSEPVSPPSAPDLAPIANEFGSPTGTLDAETGEALARDLATIFEIVDLVNDMNNEVIAANKGFEGGSTDGMEQGLTADAGYGEKQYAQVEAAARGWIELTYLCGPAESLSTGGSGRVTLNMVGEVGTVQSIVWGRFDSCLLSSGSTPSIVTGILRFAVCSQ